MNNFSQFQKDDMGRLILYRGNSSHNKNGRYYTPSKDWAKQFTQSGLDKEISSVAILEGDIYVEDPLPKAFDENSFDEGLQNAKNNGFKAFMLNEGENEPPSIYIIDRSIIKSNKTNWMKLSIFNKKLFSLSEIRGEWWIIDGRGIFADAEVGDYNHSGVVIEHILSIHDLDPEKIDLSKETDQSLAEKGLNEEEIDAVLDRQDPREYGLKHLGWKRVHGNNIQTQTLTSSDLKEIADGLYDMDEGVEANKEEFNIEVMGNGMFFRSVPYSVIALENPSELLRYR